MELKKYALTAQKILDQETKYIKDKRIISKLFKLSEPLTDKTLIRLTLIDSFYSTQMNKRYFGIEELSESINQISDNDDNLTSIVIKFLNGDFDNEISSLLLKNYGITKSGKQSNKAPSLITKYLYFLTGYNFPIYDRLVIKSYNSLKEKYSFYKLPSLPDSCNGEFFIALNHLNKVTEIHNFDLLDNFLWFSGKILDGSFSLIFSKKRYLKLLEEINLPENLDSEKIDESIRIYLKESKNLEKLEHILGKEEMEFIKFCLSLEVDN